MECLKLTVKILLLVFLICKGVETNTVSVVEIEVSKGNSVGSHLDVFVPESDHLFTKLRVLKILVLIYGQICDSETLEVDEQVLSILSCR